MVFCQIYFIFKHYIYLMQFLEMNSFKICGRDLNFKLRNNIFHLLSKLYFLFMKYHLFLFIVIFYT